LRLRRSHSGPTRKAHAEGAWAIVDQALSSGTNFVPSIVLARALGPGDFGTFAIVFTTWFTALGILRTALMQPYTIAASAADDAEWNTETRSAAGAVVLASAALAIGFVALGLMPVLASDVRRAFVALALMSPGLALQEFWRVAAYSRSRARTAAMNDLAWALVQVLAFAIVLRWGASSTTCLVAWGIGALPAAGFGCHQLRVLPRVDRDAVRWTRRSLHLGTWFAASGAVFSLGAQAVVMSIAIACGKTALGLFRVAQLAFGPIQLLTIGVESVFIPMLVRTYRHAGPDEASARARRYSVALLGVVLAYGVVVVAIAPTLLTRVFGPRFRDASVLVVPLGVAAVLDAACTGAAAYLRVARNGKVLLQAQAVTTALRVVVVAAFAIVSGTTAASWGVATASAIAVWVFWSAQDRVRREWPQGDGGARDSRPTEGARVVPIA
jgi:O-antigen/teichoic acid export membrane protein